MPRIILIICCALATYSHEEMMEIFLKKNKNTSDDLMQIIQSYFVARQCVTFVKLSQDVELVDKYIQCIDLPRIVLNLVIQDIGPMNNATFRPRRDYLTENGQLSISCQNRDEGILIFAPSLEILRSYTLMRMVTPFLNPHAMFFLYIAEQIFANEILEEFFDKLWQVYRTPFMCISCYGCSQIFFYSFKSKTNNKWGKLFSYNLTEVLDDSSLLDIDMRDLERYPFKTTMFNSLMAHRVYRNNSIVDFDGVDAHLLSLLSNQINFTKVIMEPSGNDAFGERQLDGTFTGSVGTLLTGQSEFVGVGFFIKEYQTWDMEFSATAMQDDLCVVIHKAERIPGWLVLYFYFDKNIWTLLIIMYISLVATWKLINRLESHIRANVQIFDTALLDTFRLIIGAPIGRSPTMISERLFMAACLMAFITLVGTFQGAFVTTYSTKFFSPDVNTLEQLAAANMPIATRFESFKRDVFSDESNPTMVKLKNLLMIYKQKREINVIIAEYGNMTGLSRKTSMDLDNKTKFYDSQGINMLHVVKQCARTYNLAYVFPRASAFAPRINQIILRASAAGLFVKWYKEMATNTTLASRHSAYNHVRTDTEDHRALCLKDTQLAFYQILIGLGISILVFVCEIILYKCKHL